MSDKKNFMEALASDLNDKKKSTPQAEEIKPVKAETFEENEKKPDSFHTETFTRIEKKKININPKMLGILGVLSILIAIAVYFIFFAPKIEMQDFVGKKIDEFTSWAGQYEINKNGVATNREYSFEYDKDVIISQSISPGTKINKDAKITLVLSDGPDPDEAITFPDIKNMTNDEIQTWISENKLLKTKVTTAYSSSVPENNVISFDLKSVNENNFTRGTNLSIVVSKGEAPAGQVTVENYVGKNFEEMKTWAAGKKINLEKTESYSDTVASGSVISQSVESGKAIKEGDTITVVVSKGKAVKIPNFIGYTTSMLEAWTANKDNNVVVVKKEVYSNEPYGNVIAQSLPANTSVDQGSVLELTISLYLPVLQTNSMNWYGKDYQELIAWVDNANYKGANIAAGVWYGFEYSDKYAAGQIIEYTCADGNGNLITYTGSEGTNGCGRPLPLDAKIGMKVSKGKMTDAVLTPSVVSEETTATLLVVKTTPGAEVIVKNTNNDELGRGTANELGYAKIAIAVPEYGIITAKKDGAEVEYSGSIFAPVPSPTPTPTST